MHRQILVQIAFFVFLSGCGGGGGSTPSPSSGDSTNSGSSGGSGNSNSMPNASAGDDQTVRTTTTVSLSASASTDANGDALTFGWVIESKPDGSSASISDNQSEDASIVVDKDGDYEITLTVSDGKDSDTDTITVTAVTPSLTVSNLKESYWQDEELSIELDWIHYDNEPKISVLSLDENFSYSAEEKTINSSQNDPTPWGQYSLTVEMTGSDNYMITEQVEFEIKRVLSGVYWINNYNENRYYPQDGDDIGDWVTEIKFARDGRFSFHQASTRNYAVNCFGEISFGDTEDSGSGVCEGAVRLYGGTVDTVASIEISMHISTSAQFINVSYYNDLGWLLKRDEAENIYPVIRSVDSEDAWIRDGELVGRWMLEDIGIQEAWGIEGSDWRTPMGFINVTSGRSRNFKFQPIGAYDSVGSITASGRPSANQSICNINISPISEPIEEEELVFSDKGNSDANRVFRANYQANSGCANIRASVPNNAYDFSLDFIQGGDALISPYWENSKKTSITGEAGIPTLVLEVTTNGPRLPGDLGPARMRFVKICNSDGTPTPFLQDHYIARGFLTDTCDL